MSQDFDCISVIAMRVTRTSVYFNSGKEGYNILKLTYIHRKVLVCYFGNQFILCIDVCSVSYKSLSEIRDETKEEFTAKV